MAPRYQRARSPEQKAERRARILDAAQLMLGAQEDSNELSLNEIARQAGMAKSNLYRYFESREAVLLALLSDQVAAWTEETIGALRAIKRSAARRARLEAVADALASSLVKRPQMCHLFSVLPSVLEHNVTADTVRAFKVSSVEQVGMLSRAMHEPFPELSPEAHGELLHHAFAFIVGTWPLAHPAEVVAEVMEDPALAPFRHDFAADLRRTFVLMARGLLAEAR